MKNLILATGMSVLMWFASCKKDPTNISFTNDYAEFTITIDTTSQQGLLELGETEIETNIQSLADANNVILDKIKSAEIKAITLRISDTLPDPYTFNLISSLTASMGKDGTTALTTVASKNPVPEEGLNTLNLDVNQIELLDYFKSSKIRFNLKGFTKGPVTHPFQLKVKLQVRFEGEVI